MAILIFWLLVYAFFLNIPSSFKSYQNRIGGIFKIVNNTHEWHEYRRSILHFSKDQTNVKTQTKTSFWIVLGEKKTFQELSIYICHIQSPTT